MLAMDAGELRVRFLDGRTVRTSPLMEGPMVQGLVGLWAASMYHPRN